MIITKKLSPTDPAIRECLEIHCASWYTPTHEECSQFLRFLVAGWEGDTLDSISTKDLKAYALIATGYRREEPMGEPERDRGCDEMPLGVSRA